MKFKKAATITTQVYGVIAVIINKLEPPELRKQVADHFATEFNRRSTAFDPAQWSRLTGGQPAPNSSKS